MDLSKEKPSKNIIDLRKKYPRVTKKDLDKLAAIEKEIRAFRKINKARRARIKND